MSIHDTKTAFKPTGRVSVARAMMFVLKKLWRDDEDGARVNRFGYLWRFISNQIVVELGQFVGAPLPWAVVYHTRQQVSLRMLETVHQVIVQLIVEYCAQQGYVFKRHSEFPAHQTKPAP